MGDLKGFLKTKRVNAGYRPVCQRVQDFAEAHLEPSVGHSRDQAGRCMDCGTPFCHWACPIGNYIPEWNDLISRGLLYEAAQLLDAANNLPEVTGRICPAPCEYSCVLGVNDDPVTIRENEFSLIEEALRQGWIKPRPPVLQSGKRVAVVGSGPAGLVCAAQLNRAGHAVVVFEQDDKIGGIMRYGIPDFKLDKQVLERRIDIWKQEGIEFVLNSSVGIGIPLNKLQAEFDAVCLACGSRTPRDLPVEGRDLKGIHFAMEYLIQANKMVSGQMIPEDEFITVKGKRVVVIGGGDTGADCIGVAHRQGAACVMQIELLARPPASRCGDFPWPKYPLLLKSSSSHQEGAERRWSVLTKKFVGEKGQVKKLLCADVVFEKNSVGCLEIKEQPGTEFEIDVDIVILAMGFLHPEKKGLIESAGLALDPRGNVKADNKFMTSQKGVFSAGDMRRGQSLIVWAIAEGRSAAYHIDTFLMGESSLAVI